VRRFAAPGHHRTIRRAVAPTLHGWRNRLVRVRPHPVHLPRIA
jgi:hypothetical protein